MTDLGIGDEFTTLVASAAFWLAAVASITAAYLMVTQVKNMVRAALALTIALAGVAVMYGVLHADLLAVVQLIVYIGAIMVLMVFAIMLTPNQVDVPGLVGRGQQVGAALVALVFLVSSVFVILVTPWNQRDTPLNIFTAEPIGALMMTRYVLPFEVASVLLTIALIGAIVIARED